MFKALFYGLVSASCFNDFSVNFAHGAFNPGVCVLCSKLLLGWAGWLGYTMGSRKPFSATWHPDLVMKTFSSFQCIDLKPYRSRGLISFISNSFLTYPSVMWGDWSTISMLRTFLIAYKTVSSPCIYDTVFQVRACGYSGSSSIILLWL